MSGRSASPPSCSAPSPALSPPSSPRWPRSSAPALNIVAAILAAALVGAYVALATLLIVAVLRVVRPRLHGHR